MKRINGSKRRKSANLTTHNPQLTTNQGFTLIELLVASAIMVILAGGFVGLQYLLSTNQTSAWQSYLNIESANGALTSLTNELRNAQPSALGSYQLVTANDQEIIFYSDFDYDGVIEQVRYTLTGTNLERGTIKPSGNPLTYNVADEKIKTVTDIVRNGTNPIFYYYNSAWPADTSNNPLVPASRISNTREVKMILRVNTKTNDTERDYILESQAKIRSILRR